MTDYQFWHEYERRKRKLRELNLSPAEYEAGIQNILSELNGGVDMGRSAQRKGRRGENELSEILNQHGYNTRPGAPLSYGSEPDIEGLDGIHVEIKRRENPDIPAALRQAEEDAQYFGGIPVVFVRGNRQKWRCVLDLEHFLTLYDKAKAAL